MSLHADPAAFILSGGRSPGDRMMFPIRSSRGRETENGDAGGQSSHRTQNEPPGQVFSIGTTTGVWPGFCDTTSVASDNVRTAYRFRSFASMESRGCVVWWRLASSRADEPLDTSPQRLDRLPHPACGDSLGPLAGRRHGGIAGAELTAEFGGADPTGDRSPAPSQDGPRNRRKSPGADRRSRADATAPNHLLGVVSGCDDVAVGSVRGDSVRGSGARNHKNTISYDCGMVDG
jgi:hypothetical protein